LSYGGENSSEKKHPRKQPKDLEVILYGSPKAAKVGFLGVHWVIIN
jgi:hypothetical protein